ncbi:unnamed protein product [Prorocentrum cordatum]|uniref:Uncharacterized protein n=1 Tax=Prorocentrum cordatum TaxID=2364126 RepID=A0ABN9WHK3_9DINO|nr:unnamed protein product [Polarella glacialis]
MQESGFTESALSSGSVPLASLPADSSDGAESSLSALPAERAAVIRVRVLRSRPRLPRGRAPSGRPASAVAPRGAAGGRASVAGRSRGHRKMMATDQLASPSGGGAAGARGALGTADMWRGGSSRRRRHQPLRRKANMPSADRHSRPPRALARRKARHVGHTVGGTARAVGGGGYPHPRRPFLLPGRAAAQCARGRAAAPGGKRPLAPAVSARGSPPCMAWARSP